MRHLLFAPVVVALLVASAEARIVERFAVEPWEGVVEAGPDGRLEYCAALEEAGGVRLILGRVREGGWLIGLEKADWALTEGKDYPVRFRVDRRAFTDSSLRAARPTQLLSGISIDVLQQIARGVNLTVVVEGEELRFPLAASRRALAAVEACVAENRERIFEAAVQTSPPASAEAGGPPSGWRLPPLADAAVETFAPGGGWSGAAYGGWAGDVTHCAIRRQSGDGTLLSFASLAGGDFLMAVARQDFAFTPGVRSSVGYRFAGEIVTAQGGAAGRSLYVVPLKPGPVEDAAARLRGAAEIGIAIGGEELTLPLDGVAAALDALDACAERHGLAPAEPGPADAAGE
jgi:hypothetical protein